MQAYRLVHTTHRALSQPDSIPRVFDRHPHRAQESHHECRHVKACNTFGRITHLFAKGLPRFSLELRDITAIIDAFCLHGRIVPTPARSCTSTGCRNLAIAMVKSDMVLRRKRSFLVGHSEWWHPTNEKRFMARQGRIAVAGNQRGHDRRPFVGDESHRCRGFLAHRPTGAFSRTNAGRPSSLHHEQMTFIESSYAVIPGTQQELRQWLRS